MSARKRWTLPAEHLTDFQLELDELMREPNPYLLRDPSFPPPAESVTDSVRGETTRFCGHCAGPLKRSNQKFCSSACRQAAYRRRVDPDVGIRVRRREPMPLWLEVWTDAFGNEPPIVNGHPFHPRSSTVTPTTLVDQIEKWTSAVMQLRDLELANAEPATRSNPTSLTKTQHNRLARDRRKVARRAADVKQRLERRVVYPNFNKEAEQVPDLKLAQPQPASASELNERITRIEDALAALLGKAAEAAERLAVQNPDRADEIRSRIRAI